MDTLADALAKIDAIAGASPSPAMQDVCAMLKDIWARLHRIEGEDARRQESGTRSPTG